MLKIDTAHFLTIGLTATVLACACAPSEAAVRFEGQVQAGGGPVANSTVTLWAASTGEPRQLGLTRTSSNGQFTLSSDETVGADVILYVLAKGGEALVNRGSGDNPAIAMLLVLGNSPPSTVVINEMTTVASVWTHNQFINGTAIKGHALGLRIAAGNVPSFVDLQTGGWGAAIQDPLNSGQTPTMANFATLADLLAGCATRVKADACSKLFAATTPPTGAAPTDTLTAAQSTARYSWYKPERLFALLDEFYPVPQGKNLRPVNGKPLTPPEGITFGGKLGKMQGIIVVPGSGDVWALGIAKDQLVHFPAGDWTKGRLICEGKDAEPCKSFTGPFHLAIDQQNRIWVANSSDNVTRFPASDPAKAENFKTGLLNSGLNIDSQGNVWVTNRFGTGLLGMAHLVDMAVRLKTEGVNNASDFLTKTMSEQKGGAGSITLLRPDGTQFPGSPFKGGGLPGPWAVVVDGNDNVWVSNFATSPSSPIVQLCGVRTENCPPGLKTGDQISPPGGYVGGGLQLQTDIAISPAGDVWAINNWQDVDSCYSSPPEALSTRCGGQGVVVFFGMAKPVRAPQIGPARQP